jgi:hypothetical protein
MEIKEEGRRQKEVKKTAGLSLSHGEEVDFFREVTTWFPDPEKERNLPA